MGYAELVQKYHKSGRKLKDEELIQHYRKNDLKMSEADFLKYYHDNNQKVTPAVTALFLDNGTTAHTIRIRARNGRCPYAKAYNGKGRFIYRINPYLAIQCKNGELDNYGFSMPDYYFPVL